MSVDENEIRVVCTCGQALSVAANVIGHGVACPSCGRILVPVRAAAADNIEIKAAEAESTATKICPFCAERILAAARKCRFCNEFLDRKDALPAGEGPSVAPLDRADEAPAVYQLRMSQWENVWKYLTCGLMLIPAAGSFVLPELRSYAALILAIVAVGVGLAVLWIFLFTRSSRCIISPSRIETQAGIFGKQIEWVSMASVTDIRLKQSLTHRLMGIGTIIVTSSDQVTPVLELYQIPKVRQVFAYLQTQISYFASQRVGRH